MLKRWKQDEAAVAYQAWLADQWETGAYAGAAVLDTVRDIFGRAGEAAWLEHGGPLVVLALIEDAFAAGYRAAANAALDADCKRTSEALAALTRGVLRSCEAETERGQVMAIVAGAAGLDEETIDAAVRKVDRG